jgi:hypothetical protein
LLLNVDEARRRDFLEERLGEGGSFSDAISAPDWQPGRSELALISFGGEVLHLAALARRGRLVASRKYHVLFSEAIDLNAVPIADIERRIGSSLEHHFVRSSQGIGGRVPPATWAGVIRVIEELRPALAADIRHLDDLRRKAGQRLVGHAWDIVAQERDAVGMALEIFGEDRKAHLRRWLPAGEAPEPFLAGLARVRLNEDQITIHDSRVFPGWRTLAPTTAFTRFVRGGEELNVFYVNRAPLETTLGVDLIYYHHGYDAFVMVQYKTMRREGTRWIYRPLGSSHDRQLGQMRSVQSELDVRTGAIPTGSAAYRLDSNAFFFKLCRPAEVKLLSTELIPGMYVPLPLWDVLFDSGSPQGPRGGARLIYGEARHLNNTTFASLVQDGWIGSRGTGSDYLKPIVEDSLSTDRSVVVAESGEVTRNG